MISVASVPEKEIILTGNGVGNKMRIILSPAKKMNTDLDTLDYQDLPEHLQQTEEILRWL